MAMARVSCASLQMDPKLIAPVVKRLTISLAGSTSSIGSGVSLYLSWKQTAQRAEIAVLVVDEVSEFLEGSRVVGAHRVLHLADGDRIQQVVFAAFAVLVLAADHEIGFGVGERLEGVGVFHLRFASEHFKVDAFDARSRAGEVALDERLAKADRLKDLGSAIALQRADAHLGEGLKQTFFDGLNEVLFALFSGDVVGQEATALEVVDGLDSEIRVDGAGAVTNEESEVHNLARLTALDDEGDLRPLLLLDETVVHRSHGEQAGDGRVGCVDAAIGDDEQRVTGVDGMRSAAAEIVEGVAQTFFAVRSAEKCRQSGGEQIAGGNAAQFLKLAVGEDGMRQAEGVTVLRSLVENVALSADVADERHDELFADGVDGRIGDLGEELLEVVEQRLRTVRETGQGHVGAHGANRLFTLGGHGSEKNAKIFFAVTTGALAAKQSFRIEGDDARRLGQRVDRHLLLLEPVGVGLARGEFLLDFGVGDEALLNRVDEEHAAGLQAALLENVFSRHFNHAGFRGEDNEIVLGDDVAAGAKAVAVERGSDDLAIGEGDSCGTVPRLHQGSVVLVEGALVLIHVRIAGPGFGNEHGHDMRQGTAGLVEEFDSVIERCRSRCRRG